jgi:hypothetical protein
MALSLKEFNTFKKFMMLTTSSNDAEALQALRRANMVLTKASVNWNQVLDRVIKIDLPFETVPDDESTDVLEALFDKAMENAQGNFLGTIEDIYSKWQKNGYLSLKQRELVEKTARNTWRR